MTRSDAIAIVLHNQMRSEEHLREVLPQRRADRAVYECAQDTVDILVALGLLKLEPEPEDRPAPTP